MRVGNNTKKVSIILPVYNRRKLVKRAVLSILNQSYKNYEVIIVDDGSYDKVENYLFPVLKKHDNFKYVRHSNRKTPLSMNTGLKLAIGEFITFLDSDDEYEKDHLKHRINFFKKNNKVDLIYSSATIIGKEQDMLVPDARNTKKLIHLNECIIGATLFGRAEVFHKLNGFKNIYSYDYDFYNRAKRIYNVKKLDIPTYIYYRNTPDSVINLMKKELL